ncbi:MAG: type VI secretion system membrane subunit TssM, partial [Polyangiaceae bacterium]
MSRLTLLAIAVVAAFGLAFIWLGGWFFGLALVVKVVLTILLVSLLGIVLAVLYILRLRAAFRLERGLVAQGKKQIESTRPDGRKEVLALQERAQQAIAALKATRLGRGGRSALYALPWYVIVGPPGVGKTTAIRHSGLDFPLEKAGIASRFRGIGGTKNCDWWFTSEAILLDTAGRYATEGDDQTEWFAFLDLLRKNRPRKPINGLLVAMSVADILHASEEQRALMATRLRARMDEITTRLKTLVPVYVLVTKMDMIAGFSEFWGALRPSERGQAWGMTFPLGTTAEPERLFGGEFQQLEQTLRARLVRRFAQEGHAQTRRALWTFPIEFAQLRKGLESFVGELFKKNAFQEVPLLRGVYFTSGTQDAAPSSQVVASMGNALGLKIPTHATAKVESKSFFLIDVFRRIIFPDQALAGRTDEERRRQLFVRIAVASFALLTSASLVLPACVTWVRNRQLVGATSSVSAAVEAVNWSSAPGLEAGSARLDGALATLRELAAWRDEGVPVQLRWGMYTGEALYEGLRDVYAAAVSRAVLTHAKATLEDRLRALDASPVRSRDSFNRDFDALKLYLMLGDAQHVDPAWAAPRLVRIWSETARGQGKAVEALLLPHVAFVLELESRREIQPWAIDTALAERARSILAQVPQVDRLYESLVRDANAEIAPIRRETVFYGSIAPFVQSRRDARVSGAYTKQGWLRVRALLGEQRSKLVAEQWVLGDTADGNAEYAVGKLRELYFERYRAAWRDFISDLQVQDPGNADVALEEMN